MALLITPKTRRRIELSRRGLLTGAAALSMFEGLKLSDAQAQSPCGSFYPTPPPAAVAAGFKNLVFADDFNIAGTIGPGTTGTGTGKYNFWLWSQCNATLASNALILPTTTAAQVSNGNTGGGSFASANGGILQLNGPQCDSGNITLTSAQNAFKGGYFEVYAQFNPIGNVPGNWYAPLWMSALNRITVGGNTTWTEIDINESYLDNFGYPNSGAYASLKAWTNGASPASAGQYYANGGNTVAFVQDTNWHAFGFLWQSASPNGSCSFWLDNVKAYTYNNGSPATDYVTGPGGSTGCVFMETSPQQLYLGGPYGPGFNMNIDYVRVWQ